jgi:hypothetical protein
MPRDGTGIARGQLTEDTAEKKKKAKMKLSTFSKAIEHGEGVGIYGMNGKMHDLLEMQVKESENGSERGRNDDETVT